MMQILDEAWLTATIAREGGARIVLDMLGRAMERAEGAETINRVLAREIERLEEVRINLDQLARGA